MGGGVQFSPCRKKRGRGGKGKSVAQRQRKRPRNQSLSDKRKKTSFSRNTREREGGEGLEVFRGGAMFAVHVTVGCLGKKKNGAGPRRGPKEEKRGGREFFTKPRIPGGGFPMGLGPRFS